MMLHGAEMIGKNKDEKWKENGNFLIIRLYRHQVYCN